MTPSDQPASPASRKRVRLKDVAERAGVATNTASTILNRRPNSWASKDTEERVFKAAKELGYRPNRAAVALQSGRHHSIGLLVPDLNNPYFTFAASKIGEMAEEIGYDTIIESWRTDLTREKKLLSDFADRNIDGLLAFVSDVDSHRDVFESQAKAGTPFVALAMPGAGAVPVDLVMPDFEAGLKEAAEALYASGHRRFAFVAARSEGQRVGRRPALFEQMVAQMDGATLEIINCGPAVTDARQAATPLVSQPKENRPTAIIALNDLTAIGVMRAASHAGLGIPDDISVVGIDGVPLVEQLLVPLSTIAQPHDEMLSKAIKLLMARIDGSSEPPQRAEFPTRFIARASTGPAPE